MPRHQLARRTKRRLAVAGVAAVAILDTSVTAARRRAVSSSMSDTPAEQPPAEQPPAEQPPAQNAPSEQPPADPGATDPHNPDWANNVGPFAADFVNIRNVRSSNLAVLTRLAIR